MKGETLCCCVVNDEIEMIIMRRDESTKWADSKNSLDSQDQIRVMSESVFAARGVRKACANSQNVYRHKTKRIASIQITQMGMNNWFFQMPHTHTP
jgi:hypothetical protein